MEALEEKMKSTIVGKKKFQKRDEPNLLDESTLIVHFRFFSHNQDSDEWKFSSG